MVSQAEFPAVGEHLLLSIPQPHVLSVKLNRPAQLNAMIDALERNLEEVLDWFETEPSLWVVILSGQGRAFCAGQDLKDWGQRQARIRSEAGPTAPSTGPSGLPVWSEAETQAAVDKVRRGGFGSLSSRRSTKPFIAAVDGLCLGGGMEALVNCDLIVASTRSKFALPEVSRGVVASQGGIPRLARICGHQRASEMLLTGQTLSATDMYERFGLINRLVPVDGSASWDDGQSAVDAVALSLAHQLTSNSPDSLFVTKQALVMARDDDTRRAQDDAGAAAYEGLERSTIANIWSERARALYVGANIREGLQAFQEVSQGVTERRKETDGS